MAHKQKRGKPRKTKITEVRKFVNETKPVIPPKLTAEQALQGRTPIYDPETNSIKYVKK